MKEKNKTIPNGTNDYYGKDAFLRDFVLSNIEKIYKKYGFEPLYTPIIENEMVFQGHHGEGEKLLFKLQDKDNENYVLKYDSTVPLARFIGMHDEILMPYKRYQLQQSFRDDEVDKGHFREFIQCDGDVIGSNSLYTDAEFILISYDGLRALGFEDFTIRLNHRKIIKGIAAKAEIYSSEGLLQIQRAIDYADKVLKNGFIGLEKDLTERGINHKVIEIIIDLVKISKEHNDILEKLTKIENYLSESEEAVAGLNELTEIIKNIPKEIHKYLSIDFTLARGADYYTGFIIEAIINNIKLGAVLGGGRYDELVSKFGDKKQSAVGMAFGMERLIVAMKELGLDKCVLPSNKILLYASSDNQKEAISVAHKLREKYEVNLVFSSDLEESKIYDYCIQSSISTIVHLYCDGTIKIEKTNSINSVYDNVISEIDNYTNQKHKKLIK